MPPLRTAMLRTAAIALILTLGTGLLCHAAPADDPSPIRVGTFSGTWQVAADFRFDQVDASARTFRGAATIAVGANKGYVVAFTGFWHEDGTIHFDRTDAWNGQVIRQFTDAGAPRVVDTMTIWTGTLGGEDSGGGGIFELRIPALFRPTAHLTDPNPGRSGERFGTSIAMSDTTLAICSRPEDRYDARVWVVSTEDGTFRGQTMLRGADAGDDVTLRGPVAISGDKLVVTAIRNRMAMVCTYTRDGATWGAQHVTVGSETSVLTSYGAGLAISGDTVAISASGEGPEDGVKHGAVYVYEDVTQQAHLTPPAGSPAFRQHVALAGDTLVVSAEDKGLAYVYVRTGTTWAQQAFLTVANPEGATMQTGMRLALSGDTLVVTAWHGRGYPGTVCVFHRSGTTWSLQTALQNGTSERFGSAVAIAGDTIVIGDGPLDGNIPGGKAFVYQRAGTTWSLQGEVRGAQDATRDGFGNAVAVHGDVIAVGAPGENSTGAVHIFR